MKGLIPFLWFASEAEEAARYYVGIFPDAKMGEIQRFTAGSRGPEGSVMTASFTLGDQQLVALNGNPRFAFSPAMSLLYMCANADDAARLTDRLAVGGEKQPGGWLRDKYGVSWQVHASG
jgi:predicted 3-demethylubiquinone-9 3-methyltransferase (glyoxalase superfamily)